MHERPSDTDALPALRARWLRLLLTVTGLFFLAGLYPMARLWPAGFGWHPPHPAFERMMAAIYATLGVFLLLAARSPGRHLPIIDFTIASSVVHGGVMAYDAWREPANRLHLVTDVLGLFVLAIALMALRPREAPARPHTSVLPERDDSRCGPDAIDV